MVSSIIYGKGADRREISETINSLNKAATQTTEIILVGATLDGTIAGTTSVGSLREALAKVAGDRILVIDARMQPSAEQLSTYIADSASSNAFTYAQIDTGELNDPSELTMDCLAPAIMSGNAWPSACFMLSRTLVDGINLHDHDAIDDLFLCALILVRSSHENVVPSTNKMSCAKQYFSSISDEQRSRSLNRLISSCNIEELFPEHDWVGHQEESVAACYHTLAAMFLNINDLESASECLKLGDRFEDSPRSLALKAMIAQLKGETLGAVANMVSSLQQYEQRKISSAGHYLHFVPSNVEVINVELKDGLDALNRRDNSGALKHFAQAVFNFDAFYSNLGLDRMM